MKKIIVMLGFIFLVGCSKQSDKKTLEVWVPGDNKEYWYVHEMVDRYNDTNPQLKFEIKQQPWGDYWTKLPLEINNKRGPALMVTHPAYAEILTAISEPYPWSTEELKNNYEKVDDFIDSNGYPYFIPAAFLPPVMFVNDELWTSAGFTREDYPKTWEDLEKVAGKLKNPEKKIIGFNYSFHLLWDLAYQNGEKLTNSNGEAVFSKPVINQILSMNKTYTDYFGYGAGDVAKSFIDGSSAIIYGQPWMDNYFKENAPNVKFTSISIPKKDGAPIISHRIAETTLAVSKSLNDEQKSEAFKFIEWMLHDEKAMSNTAKGLSGASNNLKVRSEQIFEEGSAGIVALETMKSENTKYVQVPSSLEGTYKILLGEILSGVSVDKAIEKAVISSRSQKLENLLKMENEK